MSLMSIVMIVVMCAAGLYWLYDGIAGWPKRKRLNQEEPGHVSYARGIFLILFVVTLIKVFNVGILLILVLLTALSFVVWMIDKLYFEKARLAVQAKEPLVVDYAHSLFPVFLIVLLIRAFIGQPFHVPTGSLEPTIMPGDLLIVTQYSYGLRLPVLNTKILDLGEPKAGDIVVFRSPAEAGMDLIKRTIGVPGDHVVYKNRVLTINGKVMTQTFVADGVDEEPIDQGGNIPSKIMLENLQGVKHQILLHNQGGELTNFDFTVPKGYYFMMGDNRDNSGDSRVWGFMPEENIIGKARFIFLSWNHGIRWSRIGIKL